MKHFRSVLGSVSALYFVFAAASPSCVHAYDFKSSAGKILAEDARQSLTMQTTGADPEAVKASIDRVNRGFTALRRSEIPTDDVLELRFLLQHWRRATSEHSLRAALGARSEAEFLAWVQDLQLLRIRLKTKELFELFDVWKNSGFSGGKEESLFLQFLADQNDSEIQDSSIFRAADPAFSRRSGPGHLPKFEPIHDNHLPFEEWSKDTDLNRYEFDGEAVNFRGNRLQPGDFLVADLREDAPGLYSFFEAPRSYVSHFAFFAVIQGFPIAVEIFEHGIRAVPLAVFLSPHFTTYVEIYRLKAAPAQWSKQFQDALPRIWNEPHAYGFKPLIPDSKYQTCSSIGALIMKRTGAQPLESRTEIDAAVLANLKRVGLELGRYLSPTDYAIDPRTEMVGWVDNNRLNKNVVDDLVLRRFYHLLSNSELHPERFPWTYGVTRWAAEKIQSGSFWGALILPFLGFTRDNFPDGTPEALAFVDLSDGSVKDAIETVVKKKLVAEFANENPLSIHDLEANPELSRQVDQALGPMRDWFSERGNTLSSVLNHI